jgi:hypothetical protein
MQAYPRRHLSSSCRQAVLSLLLIARMQAPLHSSAGLQGAEGWRAACWAAYCKQHDSRGANAGGCETLTATTPPPHKSKANALHAACCTQLAAYRHPSPRIPSSACPARSGGLACCLPAFSCKHHDSRGANAGGCGTPTATTPPPHKSKAKALHAACCTRLAAYRQRRSRACRGAKQSSSRQCRVNAPWHARRRHRSSSSWRDAWPCCLLQAACGVGIAQGRGSGMCLKQNEAQCERRRSLHSRTVMMMHFQRIIMALADKYFASSVIFQPKAVVLTLIHNVVQE